MLRLRLGSQGQLLRKNNYEGRVPSGKMVRRRGGTMPEAGGDVTRLLGQLRAGNQDVAGELVPLIYDELRRIAGAQMRRERPGHTLQATAVVHEAYMRLVGDQEIQWQNRAHFFAIAAITMRRVLLDYARQHHAGRRGGEGARKVDIDAELLIGNDRLEGRSEEHTSERQSR